MPGLLRSSWHLRTRPRELVRCHHITLGRHRVREAVSAPLCRSLQNSTRTRVPPRLRRAPAQPAPLAPPLFEQPVCARRDTTTRAGCWVALRCHPFAAAEGGSHATPAPTAPTASTAAAPVAWSRDAGCWPACAPAAAAAAALAASALRLATFAAKIRAAIG